MKLTTKITGKVHKQFVREQKTNSYFKQILITYLVISFLFFSLFSMTLMLIMQKNYQKSMEQLNEQTVERVYNMHHTIISDIYSYFYNMLDNANVRNLLYSDTFSTSTAIASRNTYDDLKSASSLISSLYFINFRTETVLTASNRVTLDEFEDQEILKCLSELTPSSTPTFFLPRTLSYTYLGKAQEKTVLTFLYYTNTAGALVINLDYEKYCNLIGTDTGNPYINLLLVNQSGTVIASSDSELFQQDYTDTLLYQKVLEQKKQNSTFSYDENGETYSVTYVKHTSLGVTIISRLNHKFFYPENTLFGTTIFSSIIYFIACLFMAVLISWLLYKPFRRLRHNIAGALTESTDIPTRELDDYEYLSEVYTQIVAKNKKLNTNYKEEQENKILSALLHDTYMNTSYKPAEFEALNDLFKYPDYGVILVGINPSAMENFNTIDLGILRFTITNVLTELVEPFSINIRYVSATANSILYLSNMEQQDKEPFRSLLEQTRSFFMEHGNLSVSFAIGCPVSSLDDLSLSYQDAKEAFSNNQMHENVSISFWDELHFTSIEQEFYPYELDNSIQNALKSNDFPTVTEQISYFFTAVSHYHYDHFIRIVLQLSASLQRFAFQNNLTFPNDFSEEILFSASYEQSILIIENICKKIMDDLYETRRHNFEKINLIEQINQMVEENIYNPNLSIVMLASEVHLSVNYLRNIYKENTGESLSNYIIQKKVEITCSLLTDTDMSIQDISEKLGFSTKNYFFTFFKKHMGMTPTQFRWNRTADEDRMDS